MDTERTFSIIKPDAVAKNVIGEIISRFEKAGLRVVASRMEHLTVEMAKDFYAEHEGKPFFADLVNYMSAGQSSFRSWKVKMPLHKTVI